jgi:hypothetical protein
MPLFIFMILSVFVSLILFALPAFASATVIINEVAWMGSPVKAGESATVASNNEWMTTQTIGWKICRCGQ